jgi:predicted anti-sigma-YlaC factor YlaD
MNISCEIIKDLLPLYLDGVCSNESKKSVEEHLTDCENCKTDLQAMQTSLPLIRAEQNLKEAEMVKNLSKRWKKSMKKALLKGIIITLIAIGTIAAVALVLSIFISVRSF